MHVQTDYAKFCSAPVPAPLVRQAMQTLKLDRMQAINHVRCQLALRLRPEQIRRFD